LNYLLATLLTLFNLGCLLLVVIGLPGTWLMVGATLLLAWWRAADPARNQDAMFGLPALIAAVALAAIGEILEFLAGVFGSQAIGGSGRSGIGALIGGILGGILGVAIPPPVLGTLLGACVGAAVGAWGVELHHGRPMRESLKSGLGAGVGRFMGTVGKLVCGVAIWVIVTVAAFWP
jgi:uncharacterized protein YqgC (DUF456 family)